MTGIPGSATGWPPKRGQRLIIFKENKENFHISVIRKKNFFFGQNIKKKSRHPTNSGYINKLLSVIGYRGLTSTVCGNFGRFWFWT